MRIISGEYGGRRLKALEGQNTRPTTDKVKESIFNMIGPYFDGGMVLDLYAGSGGLAIEAISRGMACGVCVEKNYAALNIIRSNIAITKEEEKFVVIKADANQVLGQLSSKQYTFDLVFLDPPYAKQEIVKQIQQMIALELVQEDARIVCETDKEVLLPEKIDCFSKVREVQYGITQITIYRKDN